MASIDAIVAKMPKKGAPPMGEPDGGYDEDSAAGEDSAVSDMMSAVKSGDAAKFKAGLRDFLEICYPQLAK